MPVKRSPRRPFRLEWLEDRVTPAITIQIDYRFDTGFFVGRPDRQAAVQAAADVLGSKLFDSLTAISPGGADHWSAVTANPATNVFPTFIPDLAVPPNTLIVFAAGAPPGVAVAPAQAHQGTYDFPPGSSQAWVQNVVARGQTGALASPPTDFGPWGGSMTFDTSQNWFTGLDPAAVGPGQNPMFKAALHELGHILGYGIANSWYTHVSGSAFVGPAASQRFGGPVPVDAPGQAAGHWAPGTKDQGAPTIMDSFVSGPQFTALDLAGLTDVGWELSPPPSPPTARAFAVGAGQGSIPHVKVYNAGGSERFSFYAYDVGYIGGVRVATADVTGDGFDDVITGTTPGTAGGHVKVFDGLTGAEVRSFFSMPGVTNGIFVAGGDVNGDGRAEIIVGADAGIDGGQVLVFDGASNSMLTDFRAFSSPFLGGVRVAAGDVTGDGMADVIAGSGIGATPHVKVFSGAGFGEVASFFAYASAFQGGVFVAAEDFNADGIVEIVTSAGFIPHVRVIDGTRAGEVRPGGEIAESSLRASFIVPVPADGTLRGGPVAALDRTGDGLAELLVELAGPPSSQLRTIDPTSQALLDTIFAFPGFQGEIFVG